MSSEITSESSETLTYDPSKYDWMPVREAIVQEDVSEKSIYNRIKSGFYKSRKENGNTIVGVPRKIHTASEAPSLFGSGITEDDSEHHSEYTEPLQNRPSEPVANSQLLDFMDKTMTRIDSYNQRIVDLEKQNTEYKLLTDGTERNLQSMETRLKELENQIFERDATIKELEQKSPDIELQARIKQLEAQVQEKETSIQNLTADLQKGTEEIQKLTSELTELKGKKKGWFW